MHISDKDICPICAPKTSVKTVTVERKSKKSSSNIDEDSWVCCDICSQWYHPDCVSLSLFELERIFSYHCSLCEPEHGPSELRRQLKRSRVHIDYVALNQGDLFAVDKSEHPHVRKFFEFSPTVDLQSNQDYIEVLSSEDLTMDHALATRLAKPVIVSSVTNASGMKLPVSGNKLTVEYITEKAGGDEKVEVMDVLSQQSESPAWNLQQWRDYFYIPAKQRDRIRNVISLEVSEIKGLGANFTRPRMVEEMDMVDTVWGLQNDVDSCDVEERPKVTIYCLMSVGASYTDFHIDFSGTPVYYTVCQGAKEFLMYPPTDENLELYESWCLEEEQNHMWFCDYEKRISGQTHKPLNGFKIKLLEGDLFIIPSGWIHAVFTPCDTVVIGGNFLTFKDIPMHIKIYDLEHRTGVPSKYRFPKFNKVLWLASWHLLHNKEVFRLKIGILSTGLAEKDALSIDFPVKPEFSPGIDETLESSIKTESEQITNDKFSVPLAHISFTPCRQYLECSFQQSPKYYKEVLESLIPHLRNHYETSKQSALAKKSIPTKLIGRNVLAYLDKLEALLDTYKAQL